MTGRPSINVLCVGGPADGQRRAIYADQGTFMVYSYEQPPLSLDSTPEAALAVSDVKQTLYVVSQLRGEHQYFWLAKPSYVTMDETLRRLLADYKLAEH